MMTDENIEIPSPVISKDAQYATRRLEDSVPVTESIKNKDGIFSTTDVLAVPGIDEPLSPAF